MFQRTKKNNKAKGVCYYLVNLVIYNRTTCWYVNEGKMYLENTNININIVKNVNEIWFTKKKGINWGI